MGRLQDIFAHRTYQLPQSTATGIVVSGPSTPRKQHGGALSPSSTSLVRSPPAADALIASSSALDAMPLSPSKGIYCVACKKRFSTEPSFEAHCRSEKHRKAAAASQPASTKESQQRSSPAGQALSSLRKALRIADKDPAVAGTVLWNVAKDLSWDSEQHDNVRQALVVTQQCLGRMVASPELRGAKGTAWTARSLLKTSLECDLALARLISTYSMDDSAEGYVSGLCKYLGVGQDALAGIHSTHDPQEMNERAVQLVESLPRKFAKPEDVSQAIEAMEEVASAQLAAASALAEDGSGGMRIWGGMAVYFVRYAFANSRSLPDIAYHTLLTIVSASHDLGLGYLGNGCAVLIADQHMRQPGARLQVAISVIGALRDADHIRAQHLLQHYNSRFREPWSQFMTDLVERSINADIQWMSVEAWTEWDSVFANSAGADRPTYELIQTALGPLLQSYAWHAPDLDSHV